MVRIVHKGMCQDYCVVNHTFHVVCVGNLEKVNTFFRQHNYIAPNGQSLFVLSVHEAIMRGAFSETMNDWIDKYDKLATLEEGGITGLFADELADLKAIDHKLGLL